MPLKELSLLAILALIQFTNIMDFMIMMPLGPQLMKLFKIGTKEFGFLVASYTYTAGFVNFLGIFFLDRINRKTAMLFSYTGFCFGTFFCYMAPNYETLLIARIATGVFGGLLSSITFAILGDAIPLERRGQATGIVMISFSIASSLGVPFGLYLAGKFSWNMPFLVLVFLGIIILILASLIIPSMNIHLNKSNADKKIFDNIISIFKTPNQLLALLLVFFMFFGQMSVIPFITPYMVGNVGFEMKDLPLIYLIGGAANFITMPLIGKFSDKFGFKKILIILILISSSVIFSLTHLPKVGLYIGLVVTTFFMMFVGGRVVPTLSLVSATVKPENRGSFMSFVSSIQQIASGIASTISGLIIYKLDDDKIMNYDLVGFIAIGFAILAIPIIIKLKMIETKT
jgi:MFS transporter, DHA1 family, inner membrane transport protein